MNTFDHTQYQWQAYKQGNDVWARPVNPYDVYYDHGWLNPDHVNFNKNVVNHHTYPAPDLEEGRIYEGGELEPIKQSRIPSGRWINEKVAGYERRTILRLKQPTLSSTEVRSTYLDRVDSLTRHKNIVFGPGDNNYGRDKPAIFDKQPSTPTSEGKGETVEEAATKAGAEYYRKDKPANTYTFHEGFKQGAQWQSQHSQSLDIRRVLEYIQRNANGNHIYTGQGILAMQPEIEKMLKEK